MKGYIKLFRQFQKWGWYDDANTVRVFLDILLNVNFEPSEYHGIKLEAGQGVFGRKKMAQRLKISERSVRTALEHLKSTNEIAIKTTNKFSIITVENWEQYQVFDNKTTNKTTNKMTNERPTTDQQLTTEEEYKNIRNKEYKKSRRCIEPTRIHEALTDDEIIDLKSRFDLVDELLDRVDESIKDYGSVVDKPYQYVVKVARELNWYRKE